MTMALPESY